LLTISWRVRYPNTFTTLSQVDYNRQCFIWPKYFSTNRWMIKCYFFFRDTYNTTSIKIVWIAVCVSVIGFERWRKKMLKWVWKEESSFGWIEFKRWITFWLISLGKRLRFVKKLKIWQTRIVKSQWVGKNGLWNGYMYNIDFDEK